jgi:hypothetical protein
MHMPPFHRLSDHEKNAIREALHAMAYGPFISDWELPIRCHVDRAGYRALLDRWPDLDDTQPEPDSPPESSVYYAINGALAECCHAYEMEVAPWAEWFTVTREQLLAVYKKWEKLHEESSSLS